MSLSLPSNSKFSSITSPRKNKFVSSKNKNISKTNADMNESILLSYTLPHEFKDEELKQKTSYLECDLPDYSVENIKVLSSQTNVRDEIKTLERWTTMKLHEIHCRYEQSESRQTQSLEQINILDTAMGQITKQLEVQCMEQSLLIRKLWSSSADLFQSIYQELSTTLSNIQSQLDEKTILCESLQNTLKTLNPTQNENQTQVLLLEKELLFQKIKHHQIQNQLESELLLKNQEMMSLQDTLTKISLWFPNFSRFSSSVLSDYLPPIRAIQLKHNNNYYMNDKNEDKELKIANYYLIEDLKRLQGIGNGLVILDAEEYEATLKIINQKDLIIQSYLKLHKIRRRNRKLHHHNNGNNTPSTTNNSTTSNNTPSTTNNSTTSNNDDTNYNTNVTTTTSTSTSTTTTTTTTNSNNNDHNKTKINIKDMNEMSDVLRNALNRTMYNHNLKQKLTYKKKNKHPNTSLSYSEITEDDMILYNNHGNNNSNNNNDNNNNDTSSSSSNSSSDDDDTTNNNNSFLNIEPPPTIIQTDMRVSDFYKLQSQRFTEISKKL